MNDDTNRAGAHEPELAATQIKSPEEQARLAAQAGVAPAAVVPGFEIESTLGRGGMGVVYKAKQTGLNRVVALKMLLAGPFADPALRTRFLLEAESVAALEHPGIVKVFQFGESGDGGHPYLAMEYVPGGTLAGRIKTGGPLPPKAATELVAKLADAVAHAHSRGVVHRDIKPLNVLLSADGEPRLTDFGLAKVGRNDQHLSVTGQVLGTAAYMAPEQAAGKVREVGTAADVYALGAVLYDALTGRPPFASDSVAVTLQKVLTEEPERPRKHNPAIPRDLETICLKCLEKEPTKRYPTAQALSDDLLRYLRNEPISARPAGRFERGVKWVKRNKVVAGATAAVALALVAGAGVSLGFALEARKQEKLALEREGEAKDAAEREEKEKRAAIDARNEVQRKSDQLTRALAKAWFAPIRARGRDPLTVQEVDALWEVTRRRREDVPLMFLQEAVRTPTAHAQFEPRAECAHHAAVGLDRARRDASEQLLLSRLKEPAGPERKPGSLALAVSRLSPVSLETERQAARALAGAIVQEASPSRRLELARALGRMVERLEPAAAADTCRPATRALAVALRAELSQDRRKDLAAALAWAASREGTSEAASILTNALIYHTLLDHHELCSTLLDGLVAVSERQAPVRSAEVCGPAADALVKMIGDTGIAAKHRQAFSLALATLAQQMDGAKASALCKRAADVLVGTYAATPKDFYGWPDELANGLVALAGQLDRPDAREVCGKAAEKLARLITPTANPFSRSFAVKGLAALAPQLDPQLSAKHCLRAKKVIADGLMAAEFPSTEAENLAVLFGRLEPGEVNKVCTDLMPQLVAAHAREEKDGVGTWSSCLAALAVWLPPGDAVRVLADALGKGKAGPNGELTERLIRMAARLPLGDEIRALTAALAGANSDRGAVKRALLAALRRSPTTGGAQPLKELLDGTAEVRDYCDLAGALADALAGKELSETAAICEPPARKLVGLICDGSDEAHDSRLAASLAKLASRMERGKAAEVCRRAAPVFAKELGRRRVGDYSGYEARLPVAEGLVALTAYLSPAEVATICGSAAGGLVKEIEAERVYATRAGVARVLAAVVGRLDRAEAARFCAPIAHALADEFDADSASAVEGLEALCRHLEPADAVRALVRALANGGGGSELFAALVSGYPVGTPECSQRAALAVGAFATPHNILSSCPLLYPQPRPLPPQELVELLKHPFCVGEARRAVLDALEFTYKRPFKDQWEFVEYAQKHQPQLDLLTPPKRPEPKP